MEMRSKKQLKEIAKEPIHVKFRCTCQWRRQDFDKEGAEVYRA